MNKEKKTESNRINEIDDPEEDEELEDKKMEMFFNLIRNYQEARKRRRQELTEDSGDAASNPTKRSDGGEKSGIVPVLRAEDFSHSIDLNLMPSNSIIPTKNQEEDKEEEEEEEETEKETREESGLDLNLAL
ncbi:hypothetical protein EUTSA_v10029175mg [Eutrema salsugineum]|uniref:Protein NIM1-INTERACTING 1 n=2 Tax=Eutrema salsugineum TaxID=72664 RepID=V4L2G0_EUTSA|nr:hypothetical protein EUTSA_v10029175mg [Eutrema salsugineum]